MVEKLSETITIERDNRNLVLSSLHVTWNWSDEIRLDPDAIERLQEYLNREFPVSVGKHFPYSPNPS